MIAAACLASGARFAPRACAGRRGTDDAARRPPARPRRGPPPAARRTGSRTSSGTASLRRRRRGQRMRPGASRPATAITPAAWSTGSSDRRPAGFCTAALTACPPLGQGLELGPRCNGHEAGMSAPTAVEADGHRSGFWKLALGSVGVVYGDIGTSPLYALREALHAAGRDGLDRGGGDRHRLAAALDADPHRHAQVRRADPARRQPRRGRHAVAARAGAARGRAADAAALRARHRSAPRSSTATPRSPRRSRCSRPSRASSSSRRHFDAYVVPDHRRRSSSACSGCRAAARRGVAAFFGPITCVWFVVIAVARRSATPATGSRSSTRSTRRTAVGFLVDARLRRAAGDGLGVPGRHRRRGALRRHGPFRPRADPHGLARPGLPGARAQLPRPGQPGARAARGGRRTRSS